MYQAQREAKAQIESGTLSKSRIPRLSGDESSANRLFGRLAPAESAIATEQNTSLDSLSEAGEVAASAKRHWTQSRQLKR